MSSDAGPLYGVIHSPLLGRVEYRRTSQPAPEETVGIMYRRNATGWQQAGVGVFRDGRWVNSKGKEFGDDDGLWATVAFD